MRKPIIFFIFAFTFLQYSGFIHGAIPASERAALIALYNSTNGDSWINNSGWKTPPLHTDGFAMPGTEGNWYGVYLGDNVININLAWNQLNGSIPPELGNLGNLRYITLNNNQLSGSIPPELSNLSNLKILKLNDNQLSGSIPYNLGALGNLLDIWLYSNKLSGSIPSALGDLSNLIGLRLSNNQLSGSIPYTLGNLSNLEVLWLSDNQLIGIIPSQLGNLSNLGCLTLSNNQLQGSIPSQLGNLSNLTTLFLHLNQLSGSIPSQLGNLSKLNGLYLDHNQLSGSIPQSFINLNVISLLDVGYNCLYATDPTLRAWLDIHDQDWEAHQNQCGGTTPTVTTNSVSSINSNSAICGGNVTSDGGATVTAKGVCWSISSNPITSNSKTTDGSGTGGFTSNISGLSPSTIYYVRAYAINSYGTSYGSNVSFTTNPSTTTTPTVTTNPVSSITSNSAGCGGNVTSDGGSTVIARGVCWSTTANPTINNSRTDDGSGTGIFTSDIIALNPGTKYYVRAYATNNNGTSYGLNVSFTTNPASTTTPTVTTNPVSSISFKSAVCGGNVISDGGSSVTARGVCWGTASNPTTNNSSTNDGSGTGSFTSSITGLKQGTTYYARAYATNSIGTSYGANVNFTTEKNGKPKIVLNPVSLNYSTIENTTTGFQIIYIDNSGTGELNWHAQSNSDWLNITPLSGANSGTITASVNPTGLQPGTYSGTVIITDSNAVNSPQSVSVTLKVYGVEQAASPFGEFATPIDGSTVSSSIAVTGWVLDDIGVESVKIYRTEGKNKVYIGDAVFVQGARPDVEHAYPTYPNNYKAGWGYMMLTNFLPNNGNGAFTLLAIATDIEGNQVTLGTKTILVDNASAVKPFGAIDTPTQGGTASGSKYRNWGWVLTPQPNMIPTNGSTINVWVDGVKLGHTTYNIYRSDIISLFPGYANSNGAGGYFDIDTTAYANGVHTIQWTAADSGGNKDGIGSRYFTIQNTGNPPGSSAAMKKTFAPGYKDLIDIPISYDEPVKLKKGYTGSYGWEDLFPGSDGITHIQSKEIERIDSLVSRPGIEVEGYMKVGNRLVSLPVGSTLEKMGGRFSWIPGPGFLGTYRLVFIEINQYGQKTRKNIWITIVPKFSRK